MYEFTLGLAVGILGTKWLGRRPPTKGAYVQVDEVFLPAPTPPVTIPIQKFNRGSLKNFWGPDS